MVNGITGGQQKEEQVKQKEQEGQEGHEEPQHATHHMPMLSAPDRLTVTAIVAQRPIGIPESRSRLPGILLRAEPLPPH